ncbi:MAG TPA: hypothetical protein DHN33_09010 [Eubacteriaceae bacterium]|nr:hypothetical protein [Eubacteriaceae bacterium]
MNIKNLFGIPFEGKMRNDFYQRRFVHNNSTILILSAFLTVEQIIYGWFIASRGSVESTAHFISAGILAVYAIIGYRFYRQKPPAVEWYHLFYTVSFAAIGLAIAIIRSMIAVRQSFVLPTVYIAVIYGLAFFFYFSPRIMFFLYALSAGVVIGVLPFVNAALTDFRFGYDILANNAIAWLVSWINYRRYINMASNELKISDKNRSLEYLTNIDVLTQSFNRRKLQEELIKQHKRAQGKQHNYSILILDIDHFKRINDEYGHDKGDDVLVELTRLVQNNMRSRDVVGRWGGEEFLVICPDTNTEEGTIVAEKLRTLVEQYHFSVPTKITISLGVASYQKQDTTFTVIRRADDALYEAKRSGRNKVVHEHEKKASTLTV